MARFVKAGTRVHRKAHKSLPGKGMSYSAATGILVEDARIGADAGWDVVDLRLDSGEEESAYSFDLSKAARSGKSTGKYYVGLHAGKRHVFKSGEMPTESSHGHLYGAVIGPFRSKRGAHFMANNPHIQHVRDAERLAKLAGYNPHANWKVK